LRLIRSSWNTNVFKGHWAAFGDTALIEAYLGRLSAGQSLSMEEMVEAIGAIVSGQVPEGQIGVLLTLLHEKGETCDEVAGAALALRRQMTPIRTRRSGVIDTCGTGGDGSRTFNISTAAAIVTAAAGVPVAKHGNRRITSCTGSADVLKELGVNIDASVACVERCLDELGLCFCFAPLVHQSMKHVADVRRKLGFPTIFNLLGPLANPAGAQFQLLGVGKPHLRPLLAEALARLRIERAIVVCGEDGLDEVTLAGTTHVSEVQALTPNPSPIWGEGGIGQVREFTWTPAEFGLQTSGLESLLVDSPQESAALIRRILQGEAGPPRDIVVLNAAAALWTARKAATPAAAAELTAAAIDSGAAAELLNRLAAMTQGG
jgi:anthranilate phosphoribosyltransferase